MKALKGSKTLENLMKAFAGESQARNRYYFYAGIAGKEGYRQIENIFIETAENERLHAKRFFKLLADGLNGSMPAGITVNTDYPVALGTTLENLKAGAAGENEEWNKLYPEFARVADSEGYPEAAAAFRMIAKAEERHEIRYNRLADNVANGKVFRKDGKTLWKCQKCGYIHEGDSAPETCPSCLHKQEYFEVFVETY